MEAFQGAVRVAIRQLNVSEVPEQDASDVAQRGTRRADSCVDVVGESVQTTL